MGGETNLTRSSAQTPDASSAVVAPAAAGASNVAALELDIRGAKPPVEIPEGWGWPAWLGAACLLAGAAWIVWRRLRKQTAKQQTDNEAPPHARAREALREALALLPRPEPFCVAVSRIVRTYLEEQFRLQAPERTTEEFLDELKGSALLELRQKQSLGEFLSQCDLVKFARYEPGESELRELHAAALRLIDQTEPRPPTGLTSAPDRAVADAPAK